MGKIGCYAFLAACATMGSVLSKAALFGATLLTPENPFVVPTTVVGGTRRAEMTVTNPSGSSVRLTSVSSAFVDNFDTPLSRNNWTFQPASSWTITNGIVRTIGSCPSSSDQRQVTMLRPATRDLTVELDCSIDGAQTRAVGIIIRASEDFGYNTGQGYRFQIAPDGDFLVIYMDNGATTWLTSTWTSSSAIRRNGVNRLKVVAEGTSAKYYINGRLVWSGTLSQSKAGTRAGGFGSPWSSTPVAHPIFDNVMIDGPDSQGSASQAFGVDPSFTTPVTIPAYGSISVPIVFTPASPGRLVSSLSLTDSTGTVTMFSLVGTAVTDALSVTAGDVVAFRGHVGGPFEPATSTVRLENVLSDSLTWAVSDKPAWLDVTPTSGGIVPNAVTSVSLKPNAAAKAIPESTAEGAVTFRNMTTGVTTSVPVALTAITSARPELSVTNMNVTCLLGQTKTVDVTLKNAVSSDRTLKAKVSVKETTPKPAAVGLRSVQRVQAAVPPLREQFSLPEGVVFEDRTLLVRFDGLERSETSNCGNEEKVLAELGGGEIVRRYELVPGLALVRLPVAVATRPEMEALVRRYNAARGVAYAYPNYRMQVNAVPNDPGYSQLWGLRNALIAGADIGAEEAWDLTTGSEEVIVGVIDTGIDYTHPDLAANMWINPGEIPGNGLDDDGNGYTDDVYGINAITGSGNPKDDHYHGTHCAGTIGAVGDNGIGIVGVCWKVKLMALKFLSSSGSGSSSDAISCIEYGVRHGCRVLSNSWGGGSYNQALVDAIQAAGDAGVLFVAAAGNDGVSTESGSHYPSSYSLDNILSVAALTSSDTLADYSNYGRTTVDIGAPGSSIYSCSPGGSYRTLSGTSMATPHVAGAAALLLARNPSLGWAELKEVLMSTAVKIPALANRCVSGGRLNVAEALAACKGWVEVAPTTVEGLVPGSQTRMTLSFDACDYPTGTYTADVTVQADDPEKQSAVLHLTCRILDEPLVVPDDDELVFTRPEDNDYVDDRLEIPLANKGSEAVTWRIETDGDYFSVSPAHGTLAADATTALVCTVRSDFKDRVAGEHRATFTLTDETTGAVQRRTLTLKIEPQPASKPIYVSTAEGHDDWHGRSPEKPRRTIQAALYDIADGQEVRVGPGVYAPIVYTGTNRVVLVSTDGCGTTVIDGALRARCATFIAPDQAEGDTIVENVTVRGFTLYNGWAVGSYGGAALGGRYEGCRFLNAEADFGGGAARARILDSEIRGNRAVSGGGACYCALERTLVAENLATGSGEEGGGGGVRGGAVRACTIVANDATGDGAAGGGTLGTSLSDDSILWRNTPAGEGEQAEDPGFVDPARGVWDLAKDVSGAHVKVNVRGNGVVSRTVAYASGGSVRIRASETGRPFLRYESETGATLGTDRVLDLTGVTSPCTVTAVFQEYDFYVDAENGRSDNDGRTPETARSTIDSVFREILPGETIHVAAGTYEPLDTAGRPIVIRGAGADVTFIDGCGSGRCAVLGSSTNGTLLVGFTLRNGCADGDAGGGVLYGCLSDAVVENCSAENGGGAYGAFLTRCVLRHNAASYGGGALYACLVNCSVGGNVAYEEGAGTYGCRHVRTVLAENVNVSGETDDVAAARAFVESRVTADGDLGLVSPRDGDLRLRVGSRLAAAGIGAYAHDEVEGFVVRGFTRGHGGIEPAYQVVAAGGTAVFRAIKSTHEFVRFETDGAPAGEAMELLLSDVRADHAVTAVYGIRKFYVGEDLPAAVAAAEDGDEIYVYSGTYGPIDVGGKALTITGVETNGAVVIDGGNVARCATLGVYENAPQTVLVNVTLANGRADCGGGAYMGILSNCVVRGCTATGFGYVYGGATYMTRLYGCVVRDNLNKGVQAVGGASYGGRAERTVYSGNRAGVNGARHAWGGAVCRTDTESCLFVNNAAQADDDRADDTTAYGGAIYGGTHVNATVADNFARALSDAAGGGAAGAGLYNSLVYGNATEAAFVLDEEREIADMIAFASSMTEDPLFYSLGLTGYQLAPLSTAFDCGDNDFVTVTTDLNGHVRVQNGAVDLGCYEGAVELKVLPRQPTGLAVSDGEYCGEIHVGWSIQEDACGFRLFRGLRSNASDAVLVAETASTSFVDTNVVGEVVYRYFVTAFNNIGESLRSAVVQGMALKPLTILTPALNQGYTGLAFSQQLHGDGGFEPCAWSVVSGALPSGFTLGADGVLSGTFGAEEGSWTFTVAYTDAEGQSVERTYVLSASAPGLIGTVLEAPELSWENDVGRPWTVHRDDAAMYDGQDGVSVSGVGPNGRSALTTTVRGPGTLTFHWKLVSPNASDVFTFSMDGVTVRRAVVGADWTEVSCAVDSGEHEIAWTYRGARSALGGEGTALLDAVTWVPDEFYRQLTLAEALNATLEWTCAGVDWRVRDGTAAYDGVACAMSGQVGNGGQTSVSTKVPGPSTLSFVWRTSCEADYDFCDLYVNGKLVMSRTGVTDWSRASVKLTESENAVVWVYRKDDYDEPGATGEDAAFLDQVTYEMAEEFQSTKGTDVPVPYEWLRRSGVDLSAGYERAAQAIGKNGLPVWESYVAGLDPTNASSRFTAKIDIVNGQPVVTFDPDLGDARTYKTFGKRDLKDEWSYPAAKDSRFFKVTVECP